MTASTPPSWRRFLWNSVLAFAIPALAGGIAGLVFAMRAQPVSAELEKQRETYRSLHARYAGIGNLDKVLTEVLARKQMVDELRTERPDGDAVRDLVRQLPRDMQLLSLSQENQAFRAGEASASMPVLSLRLRISRGAAVPGMIELLRRSGFAEPRMESSDNRDPHKMIAAFSAKWPPSGTAGNAP
jgi:hypothetical protein